MTDPYVLDNGVLKNKLNITSYDALRQAEADIGFLKIINVDSVDGDYPDEVLLQNIHRHIFEDIFDWAGEYRTVPLVKEELVLPGYSIPYSDYQNIKSDLRKRIMDLNTCPWSNMSIEDISTNFARKIALLWKVHPFRDGNTRTILSFAFLYAKKHGFPFDIEVFTNELNREYHNNGRVSKYSIRDKFVLACLDDKDYPEVEFLASTFQKAIISQKQEKNKSI
ncbi:MAG: Fic family protein [Bacilli bacterium]|nr:Fic family protein [Bacilli bacterium]